MVKACRHFKAMYGLGGEFETAIIPDENLLDAYTETYDKHGKLVMKRHISGLYWKYLCHLTTNLDCLDEVGVSKDWLYSQMFKVWSRYQCEKAGQ
jgi:hypothetical protein